MHTSSRVRGPPGNRLFRGTRSEEFPKPRYFGTSTTPTTGSVPGWGQSPGGVSPRVGSVPGWGQSLCQNDTDRSWPIWLVHLGRNWGQTPGGVSRCVKTVTGRVWPIWLGRWGHQARKSGALLGSDPGWGQSP